MAAHVYFDAEIVGRLSDRGISRRRLLAAGPTAPAVPTEPRPRAGFVLPRGLGRPGPRPTVTVATHVVDVRAGVTITGQRQPVADRQLVAPIPLPSEPRTAIELAEECARLSRENQRLSDEVGRLRAEVARLSGAAPQVRDRVDLDDSAQRFALLELE